ncbi:MAG: proteasome activator, partial [Acidimicrobiales bacterium]
MDQPEILKLDDQDLQDDDSVDETIEHPAKVMRVGTMMKQLLEEVRAASLDEASRDRLKEIYETS